MDVCFFCKVGDPDVLERNEFYAVDLRILRELGHRVSIATKPWRVPYADLYVVWWWTWAFFPLLRAKLAHRPVIVLGTFDHVLPDGTLQAFPGRPWWHRALIKSVLRNADANVVVSADQEEYLRSHFAVKGLARSPHVIDTETYRPGKGAREKLLATVCWMNLDNAVRKCVPETIRAVASLHREFSDYRLVICGEKGSDYPALQRLVSELDADGYVEFRGVVSKEEKIDLLQRCALYLQPTRAEGFGVAILEAMSCGAPVVTSPVGAVPEVGGDAVEMVDGGDPIAIADTVKTLLTDDDRRAALAAAGRNRAVTEFSYARRKGDLARIITQLTAGPHRRAA